MKKMILVSILAVAMFCMAVTGCGKNEEEITEPVSQESGGTQEDGGSTASSAGSGVVTLRVRAEEANWPVLTEMINSFKEEYAGQAEFDIVLEAGADSSTKDDLLADIHGSADIFSFADDQISAMAAAGALEPVPNAEEIKNANLEGAVEAATVRDVLYAYPMTADNGYFLFYDKNYLTEEDVQTMDGLLAAAEAAGKQVTMDWSSGWYLYAFFGNTDMEFGINDDGVTNYCNWNRTDGTIKGTDIAEALLAISASPAFSNATDDVFLAGVQDGTVVAGVSGVWNAMEVRNAWGADYGAVKLPTYTVAGQQVQMASFTGYKYMGVNAYSAQKEWALKLADWFTNEENQTVCFTERNQGPANINAAQSDEVKKVPAIQAVLAQSEFGRLQRVGNSFWTPCTEFGNIMAAGNPTGTDLQEIMDTLVSGITKSVAQ